MKLVSAAVAADDATPGGVSARQYDGHLSLRVSPTLHARLAVDAAEQDISVNEWAILKLTLDAGPLGPRRHAGRPQC
jgi:predicted HicB family RNase H-like nuclease